MCNCNKMKPIETHTRVYILHVSQVPSHLPSHQDMFSEDYSSGPGSWDWKIRKCPARPRQGALMVPLEADVLGSLTVQRPPLGHLGLQNLVPHTHLTKVLWGLIMACQGLWRWNVLVLEVKALRRRAFFVPSCLPSCCAGLLRAWMGSEVRVTSPRLLRKAKVECRLPGITYRCDPLPLV